jgi:hypothetical protein
VSAIPLAGRAHRIDASQAAIPLLAAGPGPATGPSPEHPAPGFALEGRRWAAGLGLTGHDAVALVCQAPRGSLLRKGGPADSRMRRQPADWPDTRHDRRAPPHHRPAACPIARISRKPV